MEPDLIIKTSLALLTITALGGFVMAIIRFNTNANPPSWLAMLHGLLAGAALTLLLYAWFTVGLPMHASWGLLLFVLAAVGGVCLNLAYHTRSVPLPLSIMAIHAAVAVAGYVLLFMAFLRR